MEIAATGGQLGFTVELWNVARQLPERTLGRANSLAVADAVYATALVEYPCRRIVLRQGARLLRSTD
jgi:hypothetical protein